jgi:glycosyltransferase involved in cell wall biosynthesis
MILSPRISICLGTYNGEKYLREQLDSIASQTYTNWVLYVSDDNSRDNTRIILSEYQQKIGADKFQIFEGPCKGASANYFSLMARPEVNGDILTFADQDDIWYEYKLQNIVESMRSSPNDKPFLYMASTTHIDSDGNSIGASAPRPRPPSLQNALIQCIAGGNTFALNRKGFDLLKQIGTMDSYSPDWFIYIAVCAAGGSVFYDTRHCMLYRQHAANYIGANQGLKPKLWRIKELFFGKYSAGLWNNIDQLEKRSDLWTPEANQIIKEFHKLKSPSRLLRLKTWFRLKLYRQTLIEDIAMLLQFLVKG